MKRTFALLLALVAGASIGLATVTPAQAASAPVHDLATAFEAISTGVDPASLPGVTVERVSNLAGVVFNDCNIGEFCIWEWSNGCCNIYRFDSSWAVIPSDNYPPDIPIGGNYWHNVRSMIMNYGCSPNCAVRFYLRDSYGYSIQRGEYVCTGPTVSPTYGTYVGYNTNPTWACVEQYIVYY